MVIGFDPGLCGGIAVLDAAGGLVLCGDLPVIGEGAQRRLDAANLAAMIRPHAADAVAVIEQVHAMPGQGVSSMFRFGQAVGTLAGVVGALQVRTVWVPPQRWKKPMGLDANAEKSRAMAIETWPDSAGRFARKKDHNRAEAALIALWFLKNERAGL